MAEQRFLILDDHTARSIQSAIDKTFSTSFRMETHVDAWKVGCDITLNFRAYHAAQIALTQQGSSFGAFIAAFNEPLLRKVLHQEQAPLDRDTINDAASEITNMLFGLFKAEMNREGYGLVMNIPTAVQDEVAAENYFDRWEKLCINYCAGTDQCWVAIAQNH